MFLFQDVAVFFYSMISKMSVSCGVIPLFGRKKNNSLFNWLSSPSWICELGLTFSEFVVRNFCRRLLNRCCGSVMLMTLIQRSHGPCVRSYVYATFTSVTGWTFSGLHRASHKTEGVTGSCSIKQAPGYGSRQVSAWHQQRSLVQQWQAPPSGQHRSQLDISAWHLSTGHKHMSRQK